MSGESGALSGIAYVLTGEASADDVHGGKVVGSDVLYVGVSYDVGPVLGELRSAVGVLFDLPQRSHPRPLETQLESSDPREQAADGQGHELIDRRPRGHSEMAIAT